MIHHILNSISRREKMIHRITLKILIIFKIKLKVKGLWEIETAHQVAPARVRPCAIAPNFW